MAVAECSLDPCRGNGHHDSNFVDARHAASDLDGTFVRFFVGFVCGQDCPRSGSVDCLAGPNLLL